jgi:hypothetical protein
MTRFLLTAALLTSFAVFAQDDDLKPAQEEAKEKFEKEMEDELAKMNEKCGTKVATPKVDWKNFTADAFKGLSLSGYAQAALIDSLSSLCDKPAYKKVITKKVTGLQFNLAGGKPAEKKQNYNEHTQSLIKFEKGVLSFTMHKDATNLSDNAKIVLEKAFN